MSIPRRMCECDWCGRWIGAGCGADYISVLTIEDPYFGRDRMKICPQCEEKVYDLIGTIKEYHRDNEYHRRIQNARLRFLHRPRYR